MQTSCVDFVTFCVAKIFETSPKSDSYDVLIVPMSFGIARLNLMSDWSCDGDGVFAIGNFRFYCHNCGNCPRKKRMKIQIYSHSATKCKLTCSPSCNYASYLSSVFSNGLSKQTCSPKRVYLENDFSGAPRPVTWIARKLSVDDDTGLSFPSFAII